MFVLQIAIYDPSGELSSQIEAFSFWQQSNDMVLVGTLTAKKTEDSILEHHIDVVLVSGDNNEFSCKDFIRRLLSNYSETSVVIISRKDSYSDVRKAFLAGASDYLIYDGLEENLKKTLLKMSGLRRNAYFNSKIYDKVQLLASHIFDGGDNVRELVCDIVDMVYCDWGENTVACQQVIEKVRQESYKIFVRRKPWLEKFIYRGDYIRDIGFDLKSRSETEAELCRYYSDVNLLFKKYNIIDVNRTIYSIGKSVIRQVDEKVTLESVAGDVYLNKTYVSHIFKEMTGISFNDFVLDVKIDRAKILLHYQDMTVSDIAAILCFCNSGYFSSLFRKHTGVTPSEYRRMIKNSQP